MIRLPLAVRPTARQQARAPVTRLPDFFVVGAIKAATTAVDEYLRQHPDVFMSPVREPNYFAFPDRNPALRGPDGTQAPVNHTSVTAFEDYRRLFAGAGETVVGETSPTYLYWPGTADRIRRACPDARILIILRNPVDRAFSSYQHLLREDREPLAFPAALDAEPERIRRGYGLLWRYVDVGRYTEQVRSYVERFEDVRVWLHDELAADPDRFCEEIFGFLGLDPVTVDTSRRYNVSGVPRRRWLHRLLTPPPRTRRTLYRLIPRRLQSPLRALQSRMTARNLDRRTLDPAVRERLNATFADEITNLEALLGRDLGHWR